MTDTQQLDADWTAPLRELIASLREMEATFKQEREFILQHRPDEQVGDLPPLDAIQTMSYADLGILQVRCEVVLKVVGRRADEIQAEVEEAERVRAEENMTEMEMLKRAVYHLAARVAKLEGVQWGGLPGLTQGAPARAPWMLGLPSGMGRHPVGQTAGSGVRKISNTGSVSVPDTAGAGFTRRIHPLNVIGGGSERR